MAQRNPSLRKVGFIIFSVAIVMAALLILVKAVPDLESTLYGFIKFNYPRLYSLSCPVLMTPLDQLPVTIRLHNSLDRNLKWFVEAQFSAPGLMDTYDQTLELQPGETRKLSWQVGKQNIDLGNFIFARVFTSATTASGMQEATCGTFVLKLPFSGGPVIYFATLAITVVAIGVGFFLWKHNAELGDPGLTSRLWWMSFMCLVIAIGFISTLLGFWFLALVMVLLMVLTTGVYLIPHKE